MVYYRYVYRPIHTDNKPYYLKISKHRFYFKKIHAASAYELDCILSGVVRTDNSGG